jgi:hypothetical protein
MLQGFMQNHVFMQKHVQEDKKSRRSTVPQGGGCI